MENLYIPTKLPCGQEVNKEYEPNSNTNIECCRTICPDKKFNEIDECYEIHKRGENIEY